MAHVYQELPSECGLACLATILSGANKELTLHSLRARVGVYERGMTFADMIRIAQKLNIEAYAFKLEPKHLAQLKLPAILHWEGNHFVVLEAISDGSVSIFDPADGPQKLPIASLANSFSGAALELAKLDDFNVPKASELKPNILIGPHWWLMAFILLSLILLVQLMLLLMPLYVQVMLDQFIELYNLQTATWLVTAFSVFIGVKLGVGLLIDYLMLHINRHLSLEATLSLFKHVLGLPIEFLEQRDIGDTVTRFRAINEIKTILVAHLLPAIGDAVFSLFALVFVLILFPFFAAYLVPIVLLVGVLRYRNMRMSRREMGRAIKASSQEQTLFIESVQGIGNIKRHRLAKFVSGRWTGFFKESLERQFLAEWLSARSSHLHRWVQMQEMLVTVLVGAFFVHSSMLSIGQLFALLSYRAFLHERIASLIEHFLELMYISIYRERLNPIITELPETKRTLPALSEASLTVERLGFWFQEGQAIIEGLSFKAMPGTLTLISGASGAGKSTLLKLLSGDLSPKTGEVRLGCYVTNQYDLTGCSSFLAPRSALIRGSLKGNITGFSEDVDNEWLSCVLTICCLDSVINQLPMGLNTIVQPQATNLSSGQAQRVLIAQAIYRKPRYLFLDEATSHLDPIVESQVWRGLKQLDITIIAVVHTPQAEALSDQIIKLT